MKHLRTKFINYSWVFFLIGFAALIPSAYLILKTEKTVNTAIRAKTTAIKIVNNPLYFIKSF